LGHSSKGYQYFLHDTLLYGADFGAVFFESKTGQSADFAAGWAKAVAQ